MLISPKININNNREFGLIVIVGNLSYLESNFEAEQTERVEKIIFEKTEGVDRFGNPQKYLWYLSDKGVLGIA